MSIARVSVTRPVAVTMRIAALVLLGAVCLSKLPVDLLPNVSIPTVSVVTQWPNVSGRSRNGADATDRRGGLGDPERLHRHFLQHARKLHRAYPVRLGNGCRAGGDRCFAGRRTRPPAPSQRPHPAIAH